MIVEATDKHVIEVLENIRARDRAGQMDMPSLTELARGRGFVWALTRKGKTLAVGGVRELWARTGEIWLLGTTSIHLAPVELTRTLRGALRRADEAGFWRVQAAVAVDFVESQLWLERFGFALEAMLERYVNKENYFMYARLNDG